jgi:hypothetical protein
MHFQIKNILKSNRNHTLKHSDQEIIMLFGFVWEHNVNCIF